jgi:hypothetical protein
MNKAGAKPTGREKGEALPNESVRYIYIYVYIYIFFTERNSTPKHTCLKEPLVTIISFRDEDKLQSAST